MLLELAIADAYGAAFEYAPPEFVLANNNLTAYAKHPKHDIAPGCYTDDTQMSLAVAEVLLSGDFTRERLAEAFVQAFARDPRKGYAGRFYDFLTTCTSGSDFLARIQPSSDKSGGAMRALPLGLLPDIEQVKRYADLQARITHDTDDGADAAIAAALIGHYFKYELGPRSQLRTFLKKQVPGDWDVDWSGKVGEKGWMAVRAAITALVNATKATDVLHQSIAFTGDVDTVATIALGAASLAPAIYAQDLPSVLYTGLENGSYGSDYLKALDQKLFAAYP
ncbi:MAG: ADP-ribosylglycohydrolase family protein [Candidatus Obscuribacterales bacterium]|nr:ADP-ribosylglycohydrolase family protein [Candidatus Obscuribacterales bacterium]